MKRKVINLIALCTLLLVISAFYINNFYLSPIHQSQSQAPPNIQNRIWMTSDGHVHADHCRGSYSVSDIVDLMTEASINVANTLVWDDGIESSSEIALVTGEDHPDSTADRIVHFDYEISNVRADEGGHLLFYNLQSGQELSDLAVSKYSGVPLVEWGSQQSPSLLIGVGHGQYWTTDDSFPVRSQCCRPFEIPIHIANRKAHFINTEADGVTVKPGLFNLWSKLQNAGFRVPITGGSDFDCESGSIGSIMSFVLTDDFSFQSYIEGIRAGRVTVSDDPGEWTYISIDNVQGGNCGVTDCDDTNSNIKPDAAETCDNIDNNCNGEIDEGINCEPKISDEPECGNNILEEGEECDDGCGEDGCGPMDNGDGCDSLCKIEELQEPEEDEDEKPEEPKAPQIISPINTEDQREPEEESQPEKDSKTGLIILIIIAVILLLFILITVIFLITNNKKHDNLITTTVVILSIITILLILSFNSQENIQKQSSLQPPHETKQECIDADNDGFSIPEATSGTIGLGEEAHLSANEEFTVTIQTLSGSSGDVRLFVNDQVAETISINSGLDTKQATLSLDSSAWITARTERAFTNPIYIIIDNKPIRPSADDACYFVRYVDHLKDLTTNEELGWQGNIDNEWVAYDAAQAVFQQHFEEAGGTTCN